MPNHDYPPDALSCVVVPASGALPLAAMQSAWERLKEARGEPIARPHLLEPAHLIATVTATPPADCIARHKAGALARVRQMIAEGRVALPGRPGGATA